jgi:hypothetical protein
LGLLSLLDLLDFLGSLLGKELVLLLKLGVLLLELSILLHELVLGGLLLGDIEKIDALWLSLGLVLLLEVSEVDFFWLRVNFDLNEGFKAVIGLFIATGKKIVITGEKIDYLVVGRATGFFFFLLIE